MPPPAASSPPDLIMQSKDHLTALPSELQHMVFGYLFPTHEPDKVFQSDDARPPRHPLNNLALTCKSLSAETNQFSLHWLAQHREITKYKPLKTAKLQSSRNFLHGRKGLLPFIEKHCIFCGKTSSRSAILMNGFRCCAKCDKEQWPEKITKTQAREEFDLRDHHLLPHQHDQAKLLSKYPGGLPKLRYGTYFTSNVPTTMFLRKDVEALAVLAHGDLKAHLERRQVDRDERRRKKDEKNAESDAEAARMANPIYRAPRMLAQFNYGQAALNPVVIEEDHEMISFASETDLILEHAGVARSESEESFAESVEWLGGSEMFTSGEDYLIESTRECLDFSDW